MRRRGKFLVMVVLLSGLIAAAWVIFDFPPPRLLLTYGLPPAGGPTGKKLEFEGLTFIELSPGYFRMGSHRLCERGDLLGLIGSMLGQEWGTPPKHLRTECPRRWVEISEPFWIATTEVNNEQFEDHADDHERCEYSSEDYQPAVRVSWWAAKRYCRELSSWEENRTFRLPTEKEWEYACRAGSTTEFLVGNEPDTLASHAHFETGNGSTFFFSSDKKPKAVGGRNANPWGLCDMLGNAWEWCADDGPTSRVRIIRGGGCRSGPQDCRPATRRWTVPGRRIAFLGFRPVMVETEEP